MTTVSENAARLILVLVGAGFVLCVLASLFGGRRDDHADERARRRLMRELSRHIEEWP